MVEILEKSSGVIFGKLVDRYGDLLLPSNVATMTLTIYEKASEVIVNSRTDYDLYNAGAWRLGCSLATSANKLGYNFELHLEPGDNAIVGADNVNRKEIHVILIEGTTGGSPSYTFKEEIEYTVKASKKIS
jgi:hypothetical protein